MTMERRRFMKFGGLGALGLVTGAVVGGAKTGATTSATGQPDAAAAAGGQPDAARIVPVTAKRLAVVVDVKACQREAGCTDCIAACHQAHNVPRFPNPKDEVKWVWKERLEDALPDERQPYAPNPIATGPLLVFCNHCDVPACTRVCPTGATWKREDGVVMMDWHRCIGCRYCMAACPYGSRSFNWRDPRPFIAKTNPGFPTRTRGVVEKCNLCEERLAEGQLPACVDACSRKAKALAFGDLEDPNSEVRRLLAERPAVRRRPSLGTQPQVYYLL